MATLWQGAPASTGIMSRTASIPMAGRWATGLSARRDMTPPAALAPAARAASAGLLSFVLSACSTFTVLLTVAGRLRLSPGQTVTWLVVACVVGALTSVACALTHRQPLTVSVSLSALLFYGSMADRFSLADLAGASLVAAVLLVLLGWSGAFGRLLPLLPLPILMAMFAGTVFAVVARVVTGPLGDPVVAGATLSAYLVGRALRQPRLPPLGLAMLGGGLACAVSRHLAPAGLAWVQPTPFVVTPHLSAAALLSVSLPLVVFCTIGGNVPSFSALRAQDFRPPVDWLLLVTGLASAMQALVGLSPLALTRDTVVLLSGPDAGPAATRYRASLVNAGLFLAVAVVAGPLVAVLAALPASYLATLAALAVLPTFQKAMARAFGTSARLGPVAAFLVAVSPCTLAGLPAPFWALVAGLLLTLVEGRQAGPQVEPRSAHSSSEPVSPAADSPLPCLPERQAHALLRCQRARVGRYHQSRHALDRSRPPFRIHSGGSREKEPTNALSTFSPAVRTRADDRCC